MIYKRIPLFESFLLLENLESSMEGVLNDILKDKKFFFDVPGSGVVEKNGNYYMVVKNFDYDRKDFDFQETDEDAAKKLGGEIKKRFLFDPADVQFDGRDLLFPIKMQ